MNLIEALERAKESGGRLLLRPISWRCSGCAYMVRPDGTVHLHQSHSTKAHMTPVIADLIGEWEMIPQSMNTALYASRKHEKVFMDNHEAWSVLGLPDFGDISDEVEYFDTEEHADGTHDGFWLHAIDEKAALVCGTYRDSHSPGASGYTFALLFTTQDGYAEHRDYLRKHYQEVCE